MGVSLGSWLAKCQKAGCILIPGEKAMEVAWLFPPVEKASEKIQDRRKAKTTGTWSKFRLVHGFCGGPPSGRFTIHGPSYQG